MIHGSSFSIPDALICSAHLVLIYRIRRNGAGGDSAGSLALDLRVKGILGPVHLCSGFTGLTTFEIYLSNACIHVFCLLLQQCHSSSDDYDKTMIV